MSKPPVLSDGDGIVTVRAPRSSYGRIAQVFALPGGINLMLQLAALFSVFLRAPQ